jgi:FkbM family methyltransferase
VSIDHPHQWYGGRTYAQHGDDLAILNIFGCLRLSRPSYLDVGAHHPLDLSNTALLYKRGCRGINVEANPDLIEAFQRHRPEDINLWSGVADDDASETMKFHRINETSGCNSFVRSAIESHGLTDAIDVPVMTITKIVKLYAAGCWPDLLTIDAEGLDLSILSSIDYSQGGPKVICAEARSPAGDDAASLRTLMTGNGYIMHSWAGSNMLFVRAELKDWLY